MLKNYQSHPTRSSLFLEVNGTSISKYGGNNGHGRGRNNQLRGVALIFLQKEANGMDITHLDVSKFFEDVRFSR